MFKLNISLGVSDVFIGVTFFKINKIILMPTSSDIEGYIKISL